MTEQRVVESADGMSVAVEGAFEAVTLCISNRCPTTGLPDVGMQDEVEVVTTLHVSVQR